MRASEFWNGVNDAVAARYRSTYEYDANGNILHADRWDQDGHRYDSLYYRYQMNGGHLTRNRLYQLLDLADATNDYANDVHDLDYSAVDITDQDDDTSHVNVKNNYSYDAIGNLVKDSLEEIQHIDWTVAGKVKAIERTSGSGKPEMSFGYGADGQRTAKTVGDPMDGGFREHYIRDAQGNIMAMYRYEVGNSASLQLTERPIYGSKRLGDYTERQEMIGTGLLPVNYTNPMQSVNERYELTDHLGNVAAVVTGRLLPVPGSGYQAELVNAQGYEAFGSLLPGRNYSSGSYRFAFQGQEKDDEVYGATGTSYAFEYRMHDARVGRFWSIDPLFQDYPWNSPYAFSENKVINSVELEGLEASIAIDGSTVHGPVDLEAINGALAQSNPSLLDADNLMKVNETIRATKGLSNGEYPIPIQVSEPVRVDPNQPSMGPCYDCGTEARRINTQRIRNSMSAQELYDKGTTADPVFSGHYGGASQYSTLLNAAQIVLVPDLAIELPFKGLKLLSEEVAFTKTWKEISAIKGMTLADKALKWKIYKANKDFLLKTIDATYVRVSVSYTSYQIGALITDGAISQGQSSH